MGGPLGGRVTGGADGSVFVLVEALAVVADMLAAHDRPLGLIPTHRGLPGGHAGLPVGRGVAELLLLLADLPGQLVPQALLGRAVGDHRRFMVVVQEGEEPVVLLLRHGVVLVIVALGALDGDAQHRLADAVHAVDQAVDAELLGVRTALLVEHRVAQEPGRHALGFGGLGQQVAGDLLDQEAVVGQVPVERVDHPVPVGPDEAGLVLLEPVRIGVAGRIQPVPTPAFAVMRRSQQSGHRSIPCIRGFVGEEPIHLGRRRRESGEIEVESAQQGDAVRLRRGLQPLGLESGQDESVDGVPDPVDPAHGGQRRTDRRLPGPVIPAHDVRR